MDLAALTRRSTYVLMDTANAIHGIGVKSNYLLKLSRGYSWDLVDARRTAVRALFEGADTLRRTGGLDRILHDVGRPLVVLVRRPEDAQLDAWLRLQPDAHNIFADEGFGAWTVMAPDARATPRGTP